MNMYFKIFTNFFVFIFFSSMLFSQTAGFQQPTVSGAVTKLDYKTAESVRNLNLHANSKSEQGRWYNYATTMQNYIFPDGGNTMYAIRLFPDTTVNIQYGPGQLAPPFVHAIAVVLDPKANAFYDAEEPLNITKLHKFRVDSIGIFCEYNRNFSNPNTVDTLIVEIIANLRVPEYFLANQYSNYGYDSVKFIALPKGAKYLNYVKPDAKTEFVTRKILLTADVAADTVATGLSYIAFPTGLTNYYGSLCAVTIKFKPGYKWTPFQDVLNQDLNEFIFLSYEENGPNTYLNYTPGNYNCSQIISTQALRPKDYWYKMGIYMPSFAFNQGYAMENHLIDFKLVSNNVDINEVRSLMSDVRIYPNPANEKTTISYELDDYSNVNMFISDLTGKKVMELKQGKQTAGIHKINVNTSALSNGVYFYTLSTDDFKITRKLIINNE